MGLIGKLKEILFDEETVEIPVITKEDVEEAKKSKKSKKEVEPHAEVREKRSQEKEDEVIIKKIETPKRETPSALDNSEDLFDMPKLKEEAKEEKRINTFTFPVFDDDEKPQERRTTREKKEEKVEEEKPVKEVARERRASGYTNAYDYSYGKYKGDYKSSRESNHEYISRTIEEKEEKKAFTPSPIISPVYGVLNENYKKEDIVTKTDKREVSSGVLDLDSVRRKAYGTLEDEIEESLSYDSREPEVKEETVKMDMVDDDEGISIDDLLVDNGEKYEGTRAVIEEDKHDDTELFNVLDAEEANEEIEIEDEKHEPVRNEEVDLEPSVPRIPEGAEDIKVEKTDDKQADEREPIDEEDLFDLIDSLYDGKGEE